MLRRFQRSAVGASVSGAAVAPTTLFVLRMLKSGKPKIPKLPPRAYRTIAAAGPERNNNAGAKVLSVTTPSHPKPSIEDALNACTWLTDEERAYSLPILTKFCITTPTHWFNMKETDKNTMDLPRVVINALDDQVLMLNAPPKITPDRVQAQYYERQEALDAAKTYIKGVITRADFADYKFRLFGPTGIKGIGKSEFLRQITTLLDDIRADLKVNVNAMYLAFNGASTSRFNEFCLEHKEKFAARTLEAAAFGSLLLSACGDNTNRAIGLARAVQRIRAVLRMGADDVLLVLVDDIGNLNEGVALDTLKGLMSQMDAASGKLVFVFAHVLQDFLRRLSERSSGRAVLPLVLPPLSVMIWQKLDGLTAAAKNHPSLHQLFLACSGHPRSIFVGIPAAISENPTLLTDPTPAAIRCARNIVITEAKFHDRHLTKLIPQSFSFEPLLKPFSFEDRRRSIEDGLLHVLQEHPEIQFLSPLNVQRWAVDHSDENVIAFHLHQLFAADAMVGANSERYMEHIMFHFEAVLRKAIAEESFRIETYYKIERKSGHVTPWPQWCIVKAKIPPGRIVDYVNDFSDARMPTVLDQLNKGFIVVSRAHSEVGVEYLTPYVASDNSLLVACVQCKFVEKATDWTDVKDKMLTARKYLIENGISHFPVVYTTADQEGMAKETFGQDGVYLTESAIFRFTNRLGILRMHTEILGAVLRTRHHFLA